MKKNKKNNAEEHAVFINGLCATIYGISKFVLIVYAILALSKYIG